MQRNQTIPIRASSDEKNEYEKFAKNRNRSVSQLFRDSVNIIMRNPTLLDPTGETARLMHDITKSEQASANFYESLGNVLKEFSDKIEILNQKVNHILKNQNIPQKDIKKLGKKQNLGSRVLNKHT